MRVKVIPCGPAVNESEQTAIDQLKTRLISEPGHDQWILFTNLTFSGSAHRQSDEIDIVVIGPFGVRVIEVKHWTSSWVRKNLSIVEIEANRVTNKARRIGTTLRHRVPNLPFVSGVFLTTEATSKVTELSKREPVQGIPFYTLKSWHSALGCDLKSVLNAEQVKSLCLALEPRSSIVIDGKLKRLAGYGHMTLLSDPDENFHRRFSARHTTRQDQVILHLYDLSANKEMNVEEYAQREWQSLRRLQQYRWAPRIVDSFQEVANYPGELKFFSAADPTAPTLQERSGDSTWSFSMRLVFARKAIQALDELHSEGSNGIPLIHRNLTTKTILVRFDNSPIFTGFEYSRIPDEVTVAAVQTNRNWDDETAPEVRQYGLGGAEPRSDVYSLCKALSVLFNQSDDKPSKQVCQVLSMGLHEIPNQRSQLSDLILRLNELIEEEEPTHQAPHSRYWTEDQIVSFRDIDYRIVSRLGTGGIGTTFKVVKVDAQTKNDLGTYVAKVCPDKDTGKQILSAYGLAHAHLRHSSLSTIFEVAHEWENNNFVALMTWIDGKPLSEFAGSFPHLVEAHRQDSNEALAVVWLTAVCEALNVLHENGLVHGDVSPRNLIVSKDGQLVLTDYDCVCRIGQRATRAGTIAFSSPAFIEQCEATPSDDIYSLAASFFKVIFNRDPFVYKGTRLKERGLNWDDIDLEEYPKLVAFLDAATNPEPDKRFASVANALQDLRAMAPLDASKSGNSQDKPDVQNNFPSKAENEVEWLKMLLQAYPGSMWGNIETRGLDSEFAEQTFVETELERSLHEQILNQSKKLVILCGNAGDGKTSLLQRIAKKLGLVVQDSATRILQGTCEGIRVKMNLDGSAAWQEKTSTQLLNELMAPFQHGCPTEPLVHCLAVNDGRLLEWISDVEEQQGETPLTMSIRTVLMSPNDNIPTYIRFINLNNRSLVGNVSIEEATTTTEFLDTLVDKLYGGEQAENIWDPCRTCSAQRRCEVLRATRQFGPGNLSDDTEREISRRRLFESLQAVHMRGKTHITMRELRATLVYILFGTKYCTEYHDVDSTPNAELSLPYWDRAFSSQSQSRQGEVLNELPRFDPGLEAQSKVDRALLKENLNYSNGPGDIDQSRLNLSSLRRYAYFQWSGKKISWIAGKKDSVGLAHGQHLHTFREVPNLGPNQTSSLVRELCGGISRLEVLPAIALKHADTVPLRIIPRTPTETALWIEKPLESFELRVGSGVKDSHVDQLHRHVILVYKYRNGKKEQLYLGADLFHLLLELNNGYQLGDVATDDAFANLSIFVQRIVREDDKKLFAWNPIHQDQTYEIHVNVNEMKGEPMQKIRIRTMDLVDRNNGN